MTRTILRPPDGPRSRTMLGLLLLDRSTKLKAFDVIDPPAHFQDPSPIEHPWDISDASTTTALT